MRRHASISHSNGIPLALRTLLNGSQLFSDPGKKRTLFGEDHISGAATQNKRGKKGPLNNVEAS